MLKPDEHKEYVEALKTLDSLPEDKRLTAFIQMENAKVILGVIVNEIQATKKELIDEYMQNLTSSTHKFVKFVIDWCAMYMRAGIEAGYTERIEETKDETAVQTDRP